MKRRTLTHQAYADHAGLSRPRVTQLVAQGMPLDSTAAADRWRGISKPRKPKPSRAPKTPHRPEGAANGIRRRLANKDSLAGLLERCRAVELAAYEAAMAAVAAGGRGVTRALGCHNRAARSLAEISPTIARLQQREADMLPREWVRKFFDDHDPLVIRLLEALPDLLAMRINPADPEHVRAELRSWVASALKTFRESHPFTGTKGK